MTIVRAAVVQDSPIVFNRDATIEKVHSLVNQAARKYLIATGRAVVITLPAKKSEKSALGS